MRIKIFIVSISLMFCAIGSVTAQEKIDRQVFEQELKSKNGNVESIECSFVQTRSMNVLVEDVKKQGVFFYMRPGNIMLSFADGDYIKMTSELFEIRNGGRTNKTKISSNPMLRGLNDMLSACMSGDLSKITAGFSSDIVLENGMYTMQLTPTKGKGNAKIARMILVFDGSDMSLSTLKMEEPSGDYTSYDFFDKKFNTIIDKTIFNR